ncbi:hypothetical protein RhiirA4_474149 [Rhizophagus irregularis]|uniref:Uncharacterized protein n=1 Tax=Rhizophagus irregularis TaxID=588596 RepID=A0A2I1H7Y1_9GLOM|nr:hypothetical protein RhiirA4_474149 [Rhizophagus irregularis]
MYALLAAESEDIINKLFNNIQMADENTSDWIEFYRQKWVIASLNKCMSKINNEVWVTSPDNTNVAEAAKNLKLVTAIIQYNVPNRERDKGLIVRSVQSNKRKGNNITYQNTRNKSFKG